MERRPIRRFLLALAAECLFFAALNFFDDWTVAAMPVRFVIVAILCGLAYLFAVSQFAFFATARKEALIFWSVAILLRLIALPLAPGDDLWRYQWEGKIQRAGFNPYVQAPNAAELAALRADFPAWNKINHPGFRTIYPPWVEIFFAAISRVSDSTMVYKLSFAFADIGTICLLLLLIGGENRCTQAAWYAWNPLVVYSFAGAAHFDSLMILPMMAAVFGLVKFGRAIDSRGKWMWAGMASIALGIAISIKLIPVLFLLLFAFALGRRAIVLIISLVLPVLPGLFYGFPKVRIWDSLGQFIYVSRVNDLFWWLIEDTIWANPHQKNYHYNIIIFAVVVLISLLFLWNWRRGLLWTIGAALIFSPVLHPWYCTWILPFATWRRVYAWHVLSVTLFAYYLFWNPSLFAVPWHAEPWMRAMIILPPCAFLLFARWRRHPAASPRQSR